MLSAINTLDMVLCKINFVIIIRENVHQVGSILFQKNFIIMQLAMLYLLLRFDHHRRPSSGTECSVVTVR